MNEKTRRVVCLVIAAVLATTAYFLHDTSAAEGISWALAAISAVYALAGLVGPPLLRWVLLTGAFEDS